MFRPRPFLAKKFCISGFLSLLYVTERFSLRLKSPIFDNKATFLSTAPTDVKRCTQLSKY